MDRVISLASTQLREETSIPGRLGLGAFSVLRAMDSEKGTLKVLKRGHVSELYREMTSELIFAIESGLMDEFEHQKERKEKIFLVARHFPRTSIFPETKIKSAVDDLEIVPDRVFRM